MEHVLVAAIDLPPRSKAATNSMEHEIVEGGVIHIPTETGII
jgi:hypothetical protein